MSLTPKAQVNTVGFNLNFPEDNEWGANPIQLSRCHSHSNGAWHGWGRGAQGSGIGEELGRAGIFAWKRCISVVTTCARILFPKLENMASKIGGGGETGSKMSLPVSLNILGCILWLTKLLKCLYNGCVCVLYMQRLTGFPRQNYFVKNLPFEMVYVFLYRLNYKLAFIHYHSSFRMRHYLSKYKAFQIIPL